MMSKNNLNAVLAHYPDKFQPQQVEPLGSAGGFSGARFWKLTTSVGDLCLRRWPRPHPSAERLKFIHEVLQHVAKQGFSIAAVPLLTRDHYSFFKQNGHFWELTLWMPGEADYLQRPDLAKLQAALQGLAQFHLAAATFPVIDPDFGFSAGLQQRLDQAKRLLQGDCNRIASAVVERDWPELVPAARQLLSLFPLAAPKILPELETAARRQIPLQPCIRDVWNDHLLFSGRKLTGMIDFGAMRRESPSGDVARLLGSLAADNQEAWRLGLEAYQTIRPFSEDEFQAMQAFNRSAVLLSGLNWLEWIYLEKRRFDDRLQIVDRLERTIGRLEFVLSDQGGATWPTWPS